jgi:hypothetical protein
MKNNLCKTLIFLGLLFIIQLTVKAQYAHTWSIGAEVGPSFSKFSGDANDQQFRTGLIAGGFLTYSIINTFGVTVKALYAQKGTRFENNGVSMKQSLNYLEIPMLGRFFLNKEGRFRPNIFLGPSFGVLLDVKNKKGDGDNVSISDEQRKNFSDFDIGVTGGVGLNYEILNQTRVLLDARYTRGFTDAANPGQIYNNSLGVTLGMSFAF